MMEIIDGLLRELVTKYVAKIIIILCVISHTY